MTAATAKQILMIIRGSYPSDGWKLDGDNAKLFVASMLAQLGKYPDRLVLRAIEKAIESSPEKLPSVPLIRQIVKQEVNAVQEYKALPTPPINEAGRQRIKDKIEKIQERWNNSKNREKEKKPPDISDLPRDLVEFVRRMYPDMDDATIIRNADVFKEGKRSAMRMGDNKCRFLYQPETGLVDIVVIRK